jgi:hypothetical protein
MPQQMLNDLLGAGSRMATLYLPMATESDAYHLLPKLCSYTHRALADSQFYHWFFHIERRKACQILAPVRGE